MLKISKKGECIRTVANFSKQENTDKYDKKSFDLKSFKDKMHLTSPKLVDLLKMINDLDTADMKNHGKYFKHIIYTDLKKSSAGSKMIAAGLTSNGFKNVYDKSLKISNNLKQTAFKNFALLCSVKVYDKDFSVTLKKNILSIYNQRPENINGEMIRFIILDQGFKEGIDLFDVKYVHLFEPLITNADETQAIGRGTRFCGQKGLEFDPKTGWPLHVFKYDIIYDNDLKEKYKSAVISETFIANSGLNLSKLTFANELELISRYGAVDYDLTGNIHNYTGENDVKDVYAPDKNSLSNVVGPSIYVNYRGLKKNKFNLVDKVKNPLSTGGGIKGKKKKGLNKFLAKAPQTSKKFNDFRKYILERFSKYKWNNIIFENNCVENNNTTKTDRIVTYTATQEFVSKYFNNTSVNKGLLLWHSVGTGKTCSAIAVASNGFEPHGYTILWVTRHTLKTDIWKNMFEKVCSAIIRRRIEKGENIPEKIKTNPLKYMSNNWIMPISYKQFTNMLNEKNDIYKMMKKRNGSVDPLKKTLVIIDEVHKLYSADLPATERPNLKILKEKIKRSYSVSGKDSVRLLLMTATPYTSDPMDLIKIINLMKETEMPETFEEFKKEYLDDNSMFTDDGAREYLDNITGYISYLNREKDARQFAYPVFYKVFSKLSRKDASNEEELKKNLENIQVDIKDLDGQIKQADKATKAKLKLDLKELKEKEKQAKKELKNSLKTSKEDNSQETALELCFKKK